MNDNTEENDNDLDKTMMDGSVLETISWSKPKYQVVVAEDIVYGKALQHEYWGSDIKKEASEMDLLLDLYQPVLLHEEDANGGKHDGEEDKDKKDDKGTTTTSRSMVNPASLLRRRKYGPENGTKLFPHQPKEEEPKQQQQQQQQQQSVQGHRRQRPAVILIHGGAFANGDKSDDCVVHLAKDFASRGFVAAAVNYRLACHRGTIPRVLQILSIPLILLELFERRNWIFGTPLFHWLYEIPILHAVIIIFFQFLHMIIHTENPILKPIILYLHRIFAVYPAGRDGKAALRWLVANSSKYNIDKDHIVVYGESSGGMIAVMLGVSSPKDYCNEISIKHDPTLVSTNHEMNYHQLEPSSLLSLSLGSSNDDENSDGEQDLEDKKTTLSSNSRAPCRLPRYVINNAGGPLLIQALRYVGCKPSRYNSETNAWICTIHHTLDSMSPFHQPLELYRAYRQVEGSIHEMHIIHGWGHVVRHPQLVHGKKVTDVILSFIRTNMMQYVSGEIS